MKKSLALLFLLPLMAGCVGNTKPDPLPEDVAGSRRGADIDRRLADSAGRIETALANVSLARAGTVSVAGDKVNVVWQGEAAPLVEKLAAAKGWRFEVTGKSVLPIPVSVDARDATFVQVLSNIGVQLGTRADLVLKDGALELRYNTY
ncbi:MAG: DotD/TraH family lipoprotein [Pseudorhodoplanes sp.]|nr:DotD/TraH family lipoprotein [Pseudorhodoplanes sp.]